MRIKLGSIIVDDQQKALQFYTAVLDFRVGPTTRRLFLCRSRRIPSENLDDRAPGCSPVARGLRQ